MKKSKSLLKEFKTVKTRQISKERQKGMVELYCVADMILDNFESGIEDFLNSATWYLIRDPYFSSNPAIPSLSKDYENYFKSIILDGKFSLNSCLDLLRVVLEKYNMDSEESISTLDYIKELNLTNVVTKDIQSKIDYRFVKNMKKHFKENNLEL